MVGNWFEMREIGGGNGNGLGDWVGVWIRFVVGGYGRAYAVDGTSRRLFGVFVFEKMVEGWGTSRGRERGRE
ncbi:hypothetical protein GBA52_000214 [Prunus armeniaca]|nr:hypothetical protein GBA52_000214 [Prunus armeniaca]